MNDVLCFIKFVLIIDETMNELQVDWTPELHRRFVQAVEQLGLDKAVPSRILELMGNEYRLTRHNIASHLQVRFSPCIIPAN